MIGQRHYGMDWLRIGAFALLILYHTGMVFVPWDFHIKSAQTYEWVTIPMHILNPWRLCLLFVVSGFASRNLLAKGGGAGAFIRSRAARLGWPLLFGIAVIVPPQPWIELMFKHGYQQGFAHFWLQDYFRFGTLEGIILPTWNHLWFVVYLLVYTLLLGAVLALLPERARAACQRGFDRIIGGWGLLVLPWMLVSAQRFLLEPMFHETHALTDDWAAHTLYLGCFLFGFAFAGSRPAWDAVRNQWRVAAMVSPFAGIAFLVADRLETDASGFALVFTNDVARSVYAWSMIVALIGIADRFWNRDRPVRKMLTEAVFPFYLIHQTIIILVAWWMLKAGAPDALTFAAIVTATVVGCWLFYDFGRRINWLRPLIGLQRQPKASAMAAMAPAE